MNVQTVIRDKGFRQGWVAAQIGMGQSMFSLAIRGKRGFPSEFIRPLAKVLKIKAADLAVALNGKNGI